MATHILNAMTAHPVRDHVRRGPERPEAEPEPRALVMGLEALGAGAVCYCCSLPILVGDLYHVVTEYRSRPFTFVHMTCEDWARR